MAKSPSSGNSDLFIDDSRKFYGRVKDILLGVAITVLAGRLFSSGSYYWVTHPSDTSSTLLSSDDTSLEPGEQWKDNIRPIFPVQPWDISTDFPYPRKLEYDVTEGTWLRLDVNSVSGEIVFDMLGDLYCLSSWQSDEEQVAHPILLGVPHDADPHFSPTGDRLVFRSDAELGYDNIWTIPWTNCEAMALRSPEAHNLELESELLQALSFQESDEYLLSSGVPETSQRKKRRLIREGRLHAIRVTNETFRYVTDARYHPSGDKVIATKWYTSEERSIGAGEAWEYNAPSLSDIKFMHHEAVSAGSGIFRVGRTLPAGWGVDRYGSIQLGPEQAIWLSHDAIIYSKNVVDEPVGVFDYNKDVHKGIYAIFSRNLTTKQDKMLVGSQPGGASRPELSHDKRTLAFVRRLRDKEALMLQDLRSGTIQLVWDALNYDLSMIEGHMGTYPSYSFSPNDEAIIIWASGQIWQVPLKLNDSGERVSAGKPTRIRFRAHIEKKLAETMKTNVDLVRIQTAPQQRLRVFRDLSVDESGSRVLFEGAGVLYMQDLSKNETAVVPVLHPRASYYQPSFVPHRPDLIIHVRWFDVKFSTFELSDLSTNIVYELKGLPFGRYVSPTICECNGSSRKIAFIRMGGDFLTGSSVASAGEGLWVGDIDLPARGDQRRVIEIKNLHQLNVDVVEFSEGDVRTPRLRFKDGASKLYVQHTKRVFVIDLTVLNDGVPSIHELVKGRMSTEMAVGLSGDDVSTVAFIDFNHIFVASGHNIKKDEPVWSKPGNATPGVARLSLDGGHDITFSRDGQKLFWLLGPYLHSISLSSLASCRSAIASDSITHGFRCVTSLLDVKEIDVSYNSESTRLIADAREAAGCSLGNDACMEGADNVILSNATVLTMSSGVLERDLIPNGFIVMKGGIIQTIGKMEDMNMIEGATVIDAQGGYVIPGFIDVHAHWDGFGVKYPTRSWEQETFLAYGITTLHNPSSLTVHAFAERARVESGKLLGPRIFTTGEAFYTFEVPDLQEAHSMLIRLKAEGGPASFSYKNYQIPSRAMVQRLILEARNLSMIAVPEGGMKWDWDIKYIIDGIATIEHAIPIPTLYEDILNLYALSGTGTTPTLIVHYGGVFGEQLVWQAPSSFDEKLRYFTSHDILQKISETTSRPKDSWQLYNTSSWVTELINRGAKAHVGAHAGGLSNYQVIECATRSAALTLGMDSSIGSISDGKLADLVVYPPEVNIIEDLSKSEYPRFVVKGGVFWEASTLDQVWPLQKAHTAVPHLNVD